MKPDQLTIFPRMSRWLLIILLTIYLGAIFCVKAIQLNFFIKAMIVLLSSGYFYYLLKRYILLKNKNSITSLTASVNGKWQLGLQSGMQFEADLAPQCFLTRTLVILNFRVADRWLMYSVVLFPDSASKEDLRKLRATIMSGK